MFEKYDAYKDSGVDWIGSIPSHWYIKKAKFLFVESDERSNTGSEELLSVSHMTGVTPRAEKNVSMFMAEDYSGSKLCKRDDLVMNIMWAWMGALGVSAYEGIVSPSYGVYRQKNPKSFNSKYLEYLLKSTKYIEYYNQVSTGLHSSRLRFYGHMFLNMKLGFPDLNEQDNIIGFLNKKTTEIDQAISIKEQQIALLNERKQIVIQQAVTQGLDPNVPMKDSDVEWIGLIPEHWELKKIKHVTSKIGSGVTPSGGGATYLDEGIPLLRSQNIHFDRIDLNDVARISEKVHHSMSNSKVRKNDVLLNITGGSIGRCYFVETSDEMNVNQHVCILRPKKNITSIFLNAVLASEVGQGQIWYFQQGGGREGLNFQALKNFDIALPPIGEQILISKKVEEIYQQFGNVNAHIQMQIEKLKEYKTTLINDAVTGKIKVA